MTNTILLLILINIRRLNQKHGKALGHSLIANIWELAAHLAEPILYMSLVFFGIAKIIKLLT
jgi:hypothetical protein